VHPLLASAQQSLNFNVTPNASGLPGSNTLLSLLGGLQFDAVLVAVAGVVIGAAVWAISSHSNNYSGASRGRSAVIASGAAALLIGFGPTLVQTLFSLGQTSH
jgi:hypothetical protein